MLMRTCSGVLNLLRTTLYATAAIVVSLVIAVVHGHQAIPLIDILVIVVAVILAVVFIFPVRSVTTGRTPVPHGTPGPVRKESWVSITGEHLIANDGESGRGGANGPRLPRAGMVSVAAREGKGVALEHHTRAQPVLRPPRLDQIQLLRRHDRLVKPYARASIPIGKRQSAHQGAIDIKNEGLVEESKNGRGSKWISHRRIIYEGVKVRKMEWIWDEGRVGGGGL